MDANYRSTTSHAVSDLRKRIASFQIVEPGFRHLLGAPTHTRRYINIFIDVYIYIYQLTHQHYTCIYACIIFLIACINKYIDTTHTIILYNNTYIHNITLHTHIHYIFTYTAMTSERYIITLYCVKLHI